MYLGLLLQGLRNLRNNSEFGGIFFFPASLKEKQWQLRICIGNPNSRMDCETVSKT
jgi:hypothetical protein